MLRFADLVSWQLYFSDRCQMFSSCFVGSTELSGMPNMSTCSWRCVLVVSSGVSSETREYEKEFTFVRFSFFLDYQLSVIAVGNFSNQLRQQLL